MGTKERDLRLLTLLFAVLLAGATIWLFLPELTTLAWHLVHGNSVEVDGWKIPVPTDWFAITEKNKATLLLGSRLTHGNADGELGVSTIKIPAGSDYTSDDWKARYLLEMERRGYKFRGARITAIDGITAYCFDFFIENESGVIQWNCDLPAASLGFIYHGTEKHSLEAASILGHVRRDSKSSNTQCTIQNVTPTPRRLTRTFLTSAES